MNYHYVYGGWDPGVYGHNPEYMPAPAPLRGLCRCPDSGKDSVRSRTGSRCRRCHLDRVTSHGSQAARKHTRAKLPMAGSSPDPRPSSRDQSRNQRRPSPSPRDPYDYIRRTRLKADEWDTYWDTSPSPRSSSSPQSSRTSPVQVHPPPSPHSRPDDRAGRDHQLPELPLSTAQQQRQLPRLSPLPAITPLSALHCEDEDSQYESKPISSLPPIPIGESEVDIPLAPLLDKSEREVETPLGSLTDEHAVFADLVSMKSKLSAAEVRYRKYQRRKPLRKVLLQLEDVIIEENEEELAAASDDNYASLTAPGEGQLSSSDDELGVGKYSVVTTNFADEIMSEIYGSTKAAGAAEPAWRDTSMSPRSLADEILEELYGEVGGHRDHGEPDGEPRRPEGGPSSPGRIRDPIFNSLRPYPPSPELNVRWNKIEIKVQNKLFFP